MFSLKNFFVVVFSLAILLLGIFFVVMRYGKSGAAVSVLGKKVSVATTENLINEVPIVSREKPAIKIIFGGDMMFDRYIRTIIARHGDEFVLGGVTEVLGNADVVVANLEGPITESQSVSEASIIGEAKNYVFTFPTDTAAMLKKNHIDIVNIGNNHILNFQTTGVRDTERLLEVAGVGFFGSPLPEEKRIYIEDVDGIKVAFVNYNQFVYQGKEKAFADIADAREQADVVIVYAHWGVEYKPVQSSVRELAHRFIDLGVDAIIGSHPHIVQEKEEYHGKTIYYSLGNFIFDQYFSEDTKRGLLVEMTLDPKTKELSFRDIPLVLDVNGQTRLAR